MQRLHGWFDQLTMRRSRRARDNQNERAQRSHRTSHSVAPSCRLNTEKKQLKPVPIPQIVTPIPPPMPPWNCTNGLSSSTRRRGIRTNPWLYTSHPPPPSITQTDVYFNVPLSLDRRRPPPSLGVKGLEESTCSSGYGSQDCSPDSSVHLPPWQNASPRGTWDSQQRSWHESKREPEPRSWRDQPAGGDWQAASCSNGDDDGCFLEDTSSFSTYDNICDEHIYHELELICRRPTRCYSSSDCLSSSSDPSSSPPSPQPRADSPIYAQPWRHYPELPPLVVHNQAFRQLAPPPRRQLPARPSSPIYATPYTGPMARPYAEENSFIYPGSFLSRLEKSPGRRMKEEKEERQRKRETEENDRVRRRETEENDRVRRRETEEKEQPLRKNVTLDDVEREFLSELDAQINELQQRSEDLRCLVERARERREAEWARPSMECTFELDL